MAHALPHAGHADAQRGDVAVHFLQFLRRNAGALVAHFEDDLAGLACEFDERGLAAGVARDVRQRLLHDAEDGDLDVGG
ncbi:MAG: hypothetical protein B9S33_14775 [Pedosphaera sp. Tous-C6FEB]|nr:MAG: hypothetical protein B9S33_14775 [Pedosphaera sp. Tous-C6FEB]